MSRTYEQPGVNLDPEEALLLGFHRGEYDAVVDSVVSGFGQEKSPSFLSIVRPELLTGFAETLLDSDSKILGVASPVDDRHKAALFESLLARAEAGEADAISALPKFATTVRQLVTAMGLVLEFRDPITEWRTDRANVQQIGSYNPQHVGHRATMAATLATAGERSSVTAQIVANHPVKKDSLPPYAGRYAMGERNLYRSSLIDPTRVNLIDVPVGPGLSKVGLAQIELLADVSGDSQLRWLLGSDKFMSDVKTAREGQSGKRAITRFADPRIHLYVARRVVHERAEVQEGIDFVQDSFGTAITFIDEPASELVLGASASLIRQLHAEGKHEEADRIQFADLPEYSS